MRLLALPAVLLVAACATPTLPEVEIRTVEVEVEVPISCVPELPIEPVYPDIDLSGVTNIEIGVRRLRDGRTLRIIRIEQLEAALNGCAGD